MGLFCIDVTHGDRGTGRGQGGEGGGEEGGEGRGEGGGEGVVTNENISQLSYVKLN